MPGISLTDDSEVVRIARDLSGKYGYEAVAYVKSRADRASEIGDELALDIWKQVLAVMNAFAAHRF
jgi:hypothetical protein